MAPMKAMKVMKAMKGGKQLTKGAIAKALAEAADVKSAQVSKLLDSLSALATTEVKSTGVFTVPGLCRIKTRVRPATKAGVRNIFGKDVKVKARPAKTVVKAF